MKIIIKIIFINILLIGVLSTSYGYYDAKLDDDIEDTSYAIQDVTTVGRLKDDMKKFENCLELHKYSGGSWQTYCQPRVRPKSCSPDLWNELQSTATIYC